MPKTKYSGMGFVAVDDDLELGFKEAVHRGNDDVKGGDDEVGLLGSPLKVVLRTNLNGGRVSEGSGNNQFIVSDVEELSRSETFVLKGS